MFEAEKSVVQQWVDLLAGSGDEVWAGFEALMSPDMLWNVPGNTSISGTHRGLEAIQRDFFGPSWEERR